MQKPLLFVCSLILSNVALSTAQDGAGEDSECGCFLINGSNPTYYTNHLFFDFRSLGEYVGVPTVISNATRSSYAPPTSDYFTSDDWTNVWEIQGWNNSQSEALSGDATVLMVNSPNNIYIQEDDDSSLTFMTMRTQRLRGFQTAAEFQTASSNYQFLSIRMLARIIGSPGAVAAMFTYRDAEELVDVQEADIEVLTCGPRDRIQYTNQPSYTVDGDNVPDTTANASLPGDLLWSDWAVHRLDWTPDSSVWYFDGQEVAAIENQTPRDGSSVNFNMWSDGGSWSGNMTLFDAAYMQIQWIEMVFNTTDAQSDDGCAVVCSVDETSEIGVASVLWESEAHRRSPAYQMLLICAIALWISFT